MAFDLPNPRHGRSGLANGLIALLITWSLALSPGPARGQDQAGGEADPAKALPVLMALVDGSGSMWGGLGSEGRSKLAATREALEAVLPRLAGSNRLGLATFGPGCRSAAIVTPAQTSQVQDVTGPLVRFNPRGKGPLSAGLRTAAEGFSANDAGSIVLFHDGVDNCGEDQCAAASELHAARPGLKVSTISLGMDPPQVAAVACVAKITGGRAYTADDPEGVVRALDDIANMNLRPVPAEAPPAKPAPAPRPAAKGPPRLLASAQLVAGGAAVSMPMTWRVRSPDGSKVVHEAVAPSLAVQLSPGPKRVEVTSGRITVTRDVEIANEGDTVLSVPLDAGIVRFDTGAKRLASDAEEPLIRLEKLTMVDAGAAAKGAVSAARVATPLWIARGKVVEAMLPPGEYRAIAEYGLARAAAPVRVATGEALNLSLPLEAGRLELETVPADIDSIVYRIEVDDPDRPGGRRELTRTANAAPTFVLSTGSYYVTASAGGEELRRLVTVRSGEVTRETFKPDTTRLTVMATINGLSPGSAPLTLSIARQDRAAEYAKGNARPHSLGQDLELSQGDYRVSVRYGLSGPTVSRDLQLKPAATKRVTLDLKVAEVRLDTAGNDGSAQGALCELKTSDGTVLWRTVETRPTRLVDPGQYTMHCRSGRNIRDIAITAAAGRVTNVTPFAQ